MPNATSVKKAVIPAAGHATRQFPASASVQKGLFPIVDRDGYSKPVLQLAVEEALSAGIEEVAIVVSPADEREYRRAFEPLSEERRAAFSGNNWALQMSEHLATLGERITFLHQPEARGFGHAVWCAREWVGDAPCLVMLGDHVFLSQTAVSCSRQLIEAFTELGRSTSALHRFPSEKLCLYGTAHAEPLQTPPRAYRLHEIVEKPDPEYARQHLQSPTLSAETYLGWFGQHLVMPEIFESLQALIDKAGTHETGFTEAQIGLLERGAYYGVEIQGEAFDTGQPDQYLYSVARMGLAGPHREIVEKAIRKN